MTHKAEMENRTGQGNGIELELIKLVACGITQEDKLFLPSRLQEHLNNVYKCTRYLCLYYNTKTQTHLEFNMLPPQLHVGLPNPKKNICFRLIEDTASLECKKKVCACGSKICKPYDASWQPDDLIKKVPKELSNAIKLKALDRWHKDWSKFLPENWLDLPFWLMYELFLHDMFNPYNGTLLDAAAKTPLFKLMITCESKLNAYEDGIFRGDDTWFDEATAEGFKLSVFNTRNELDTHFVGSYLIRPVDTEHEEQAALLLAYGPDATMRAMTSADASKLLGFLSMMCWPPLVREIIRDMTTAHKVAVEAKADFDSLAHLTGVETDVRRMMQDIEHLRSRAIELQSKIAPAAVGLPARAHELMPLFGQGREVVVRLTDANAARVYDVTNCIASSVSLKNYVMELSDTDTDLKEERKDPNACRLDGQVDSIIEGLHSDGAISGTMETSKMDRILAVAGLFGRVNHLHILTDICGCSCSVSARFRALKIICQQFVAPKRVPNRDSVNRKAFMSDIQLLATILEAVTEGAKVFPSISYKLGDFAALVLSNRDEGSRRVFLASVMGIAQSSTDCWVVENPEQQQAATGASVMTYSVLPMGKRPVDILAPLFRLIKEELSAGGGRSATLEKVTIQSMLNDLVITLTTSPCIPVREIHSREDAMTGRHGLSGCLWEMAQALGSSQVERHLAQVPTKIPPDVVEPVSIWEDTSIATYILIHIPKLSKSEKTV